MIKLCVKGFKDDSSEVVFYYALGVQVHCNSSINRYIFTGCQQLAEKENVLFGF